MKTIITFVLVLLSSPSLSADDFWLAAGGGGATKGLAIYGGLSLQIQRHILFGLRGVKTTDLSTVNEGRDGWFDGPEFSEAASDYGFLLGWIIAQDKEQKSIFTTSLGIGVVTVTERGRRVNNWLGPDYWAKEQNSATGLALESQIFFRKFGFVAFANVNSLESFGGLVVSWRFLSEIQGKS